MSDTLEEKKPNDPGSYQPSQAVVTTAPIIAQITGGDSGNTVAGVQAAQKADNSVFSQLATSIQSVTSQLGAAFKAGGAAASSGAGVAQRVEDLSQAKAKALLESGQAQANIVLNKAVADKEAAKATAADAISLGLDPNNPEAQAGMKAVRDNAANTFKHANALGSMNEVGFFDNPAAYLMNHVINMPVEQSRLGVSLTATKAAAGAIASQTESLRNRSVVDSALHSADLTSDTADVYKKALGDAAAGALDSITKDQQIKISAYNLGVNQASLAISAQHLKIAQEDEERKRAMFPGQLLAQQQEAKQRGIVTEYYGQLKEEEINKLRAQATELAQVARDKVAKDTRDAATLGTVNDFYSSIGLRGNIDDLARMPKEVQTPVLEMATNFKVSGQLAQDPYTALDLLTKAKVPLTGLPSSQLPTIAGIDFYKSQGVTAAGVLQPGQAKLTGKELEDTVRGFTNQKILQEQNDINSGNKLFTMPSVGALVSRPWAADNPILQAMKPLTVDGNGGSINRPTDGSLLINTAVQLVNEGKLTEAQAVAKLKEIGRNTLNDIQTAGGFKRFGIPIQEKFPVSFVKSGSLLSTSHLPVDLYNSADILNKLRIQRAGSQPIATDEFRRSLGGGLLQ